MKFEAIKNNCGKAIIIIMAVLNSVSMSACSMINRETADDICTALENKYDEKFEVTYIGDRLNRDTTSTFIRPQNNNDIIFTAKIDHSGNVTDDYVNRIILHSVEKKYIECFSETGISLAANAAITQKDIFETDKNLNPNEFVLRNNIDSLLLQIVFDHQDGRAGDYISTLEKASTEFDFELVVCAYFFDHEAFLDCEKMFDRYPVVGATLIESFSPLFSTKIVVSNGKSSMSESELKNILEGK